MSTDKRVTKIEYGDFQTPAVLAAAVCGRLSQLIQPPTAIVEPTCGQGSLLLAALDAFPTSTNALGVDINQHYIAELTVQVAKRLDADKVQLRCQDFFQITWATALIALPDPLLVVGNPPWVTNAGLTTLESENLPHKSNFQGFTGLEAITGKSNFDISEWMLIHLLEQLRERAATLAMLCKTAVARRVLTFAWQNGLPIDNPSFYLIDAKTHFNAAVDACLFVCHLGNAGRLAKNCDIYADLTATSPSSTFGYVQNQLVANLPLYAQWGHLVGESPYQWRSGIKHDCAKVMELAAVDHQYRNGLDEVVDLEPLHLYPLLKSSELAKSGPPMPTRFMLVPQSYVGQETCLMQTTAPQTWSYLLDHAAWLDQRKSSIYRKQPRFAIFGIGPYTFTPWKVAISGLYKQLRFTVVGPHQGKPVVLDDTCYFIACASSTEAELLATMLNSTIAQQFFHAFIFWDNKRPITATLLNQLNLLALAKELKCELAFQQLLTSQSAEETELLQLPLFA